MNSAAKRRKKRMMRMIMHNAMLMSVLVMNEFIFDVE